MMQTNYCFKTLLAGILLPVSVGLTAQVVQAESLDAYVAIDSNVLVAQGYGSFTGVLSQLEIMGDRSFDQGMNFWNTGDYYNAHLSFHTAANYYWQCKQDYTVQGRPDDAARVEGKYNDASVRSQDALQKSSPS